MDNNTILGAVAIALSVTGTVVAVINHTKIKSKCCGKKLEMSLDISKTTESPSDLKISVPVQSGLNTSG
jgi:hypothetical protein